MGLREPKQGDPTGTRDRTEGGGATKIHRRFEVVLIGRRKNIVGAGQGLRVEGVVLGHGTQAVQWLCLLLLLCLLLVAGDDGFL